MDKAFTTLIHNAALYRKPLSRNPRIVVLGERFALRFLPVQYFRCRSLTFGLMAPNGFAQKEKCPAGSTFVGNLEGAGSFNNNLNSRPNVVLPAGFVLNESYHQPTLQSFGGGSDARSTMQASEVPAGLFIAPYGTEDHDKGWAVHTPELAPAVWKGNIISQFKFSLTLYCTTGSSALNATTGGCNVKVPVCAVPAAKDGVHKKTGTQPAASKND